MITVLAENSEVVKRQRRWNTEQQLTNNHSAVTSPKDTIQTPVKRVFSRSESKIDQELPKERIGMLLLISFVYSL